MRNEFTHKQHLTEMVNFNEYSNRRQKELIKRHALSQKQLPKNIKVSHCRQAVAFCETFVYRSNKPRSSGSTRRRTTSNRASTRS